MKHWHLAQYLPVRQFPYLLALSVCLFGFLHGRELEQWYQVTGTVSLDENYSIRGIIEERYQPSHPHLFHYYYEINFVRSLACDWNFIWGFRQAYTRHLSGKRTDPIPLLSLTKQWKFDGFVVSNRFRIEYEFNNRLGRYRNRFQVELPAYTAWKIHPYIYDEIFITTQRGYNQNRLFIGFKKELFPQFEASIAYLIRQQKTEAKQWIVSNALVFSFFGSF